MPYFFHANTGRERCLQNVQTFQILHQLMQTVNFSSEMYNKMCHKVRPCKQRSIKSYVWTDLTFHHLDKLEHLSKQSHIKDKKFSGVYYSPINNTSSHLWSAANTPASPRVCNGFSQCACGSLASSRREGCYRPVIAGSSRRRTAPPCIPLA